MTAVPPRPAAPDASERAQFLRLITSLSDSYRPEGVLIWLQSPNRNLRGYTPMEVLRDRGWEPLLQEADRIAGGPS